MDMVSMLLTICVENPLVTGKFSSNVPEIQNFDYICDVDCISQIEQKIQWVVF